MTRAIDAPGARDQMVGLETALRLEIGFRIKRAFRLIAKGGHYTGGQRRHAELDRQSAPGVQDVDAVFNVSNHHRDRQGFANVIVFQQGDFVSFGVFQGGRVVNFEKRGMLYMAPLHLSRTA